MVQFGRLFWFGQKSAWGGKIFLCGYKLEYIKILIIYNNKIFLPCVRQEPQIVANGLSNKIKNKISKWYELLKFIVRYT